jgi:hypothetical protein
MEQLKNRINRGGGVENTRDGRGYLTVSVSTPPGVLAGHAVEPGERQMACDQVDHVLPDLVHLLLLESSFVGERRSKHTIQHVTAEEASPEVGQPHVFEIALAEPEIRQSRTDGCLLCPGRSAHAHDELACVKAVKRDNAIGAVDLDASRRQLDVEILTVRGHIKATN